MGVGIIGTGKALPNLKVENQKLTELVDTDNQWIIDRTGIEARHIATKETGVDLAVAASEQALGDLDRSSIGLVVVATVTPDMLVPSMGALVKKELGLENAVAFDINTACSGFIYGLWVAESLMKNGAVPGGNSGNQINRALVIGVERLSRIVNWNDRGTCILFGDGAGSAVLELSESKPGILGSYVKNYDDVTNSLTCGIEYIKTPFTEEGPQDNFLKMNGTQVYRFAVNAVGEVMDKVLEITGVSPDEVKYYVPHQANMRIINSIVQRFKQPIEKFQVNIYSTGNVSAASIPMALSDLMATGKVKPGDKIMMVGFGGGLSAGAILFEA
ncbi:3-oxoacyl-ACP synthase III family protein [Sinanaerobacter chloroacetimidivorans]|uniref:Ketoacyl-ACP synthase III n=1 Tax=Sinanaerobacter chloroacetimidivorans TaxID=2818044 RepID=A0A8J7W045_9FIRM|nr:beta-ketoacyl-ACP synthase III [Sinanaerobacter chloroacetimidivorans]MBR0597904.1 ketoacyl-ACP synthase III [Sinanaerobacter chloroacetimidivorans]